jgi:hypothetical protein
MLYMPHMSVVCSMELGGKGVPAHAVKMYDGWTVSSTKSETSAADESEWPSQI